MTSTADVAEVIEIVLKELDSVWANAYGAHLEDEKNAFNAGRYEGLTQAIAVVESIMARGRCREDSTPIRTRR